MEEKIKILHLEDLPSDAELVARELKNGNINCEIFVVDNKQKFNAALKTFAPDVILSDHSLAAFDSYEALQLVREAGISVPFILVTAMMTDEYAANVMKQGADDYIIKDRLHRLPLAVINSIEKRQLEAQRIAAHERFLFHIENTPLGFIEWDAQLQIKSISKRAEEIFGWSLKEFTGSGWNGYTMVYPEDLHLATKIVDDLMHGSITRNSGQYRNLTKFGKVIWCEWYNSVLKDKEGKVITIMSLVKDITHHKQAEENLIKSEAMLSTAQAIAQMGNWEIDLTRDLHTWSDEMFNIFGILKDENIPSRELYASFIHPDDLSYANGKMDQAFASLKNSSFDFRVVRGDGAIRYAYTEWRFEFNKDGIPIALFGIIQDITDRTLAESERTKMLNDLVQRNKDLEQFAYIISHNLRAPVANIMGAINILDDDGLSLEEKNVLNSGLRISVSGLDHVVKDLNQILQIKREVNETREIVVFSQLVDDIKISIQNLVDVNHIELRYDFSEIDEYVTLKSYLYSIFYNLISNSIKYRRQHVHCLIKIKSHISKNKIELLFTDNGMGIDLEKRGDQVFGLYKRFHTTIEGKGMGLFMVKTQVESLGGKIRVRSTVDEGTEFKIEFER